MAEQPQSRFEALYRVELSGERVWMLQLENGQMLAVREHEICLYATRESISNGDKPLGVIDRGAKPNESKTTQSTLPL